MRSSFRPQVHWRCQLGGIENRCKCPARQEPPCLAAPSLRPLHTTPSPRPLHTPPLLLTTAAAGGSAGILEPSCLFKTLCRCRKPRRCPALHFMKRSPARTARRQQGKQQAAWAWVQSRALHWVLLRLRQQRWRRRSGGGGGDGTPGRRCCSRPTPRCPASFQSCSWQRIARWQPMAVAWLRSAA